MPQPWNLPLILPVSEQESHEERGAESYRFRIVENDRDRSFLEVR